MELLITKIIGSLLVAPGMMFALMLLGIGLYWRFKRTAKSLFIVGLILLLLASLPIVSQPLIEWAEDIPPVDMTALNQNSAQAIIVLGGGRYTDAPEYRKDTIGYMSLVRVRYTAQLHKITQLPILTTGGSVYGERISEAELMQQVLTEELSAKVKWVEDKSRTTQENARFAMRLLESENIKSIILVTHALHMRRAQTAFEKAGFNVIPAPMGYHTPSDDPFYFRLLPSAYALKNSRELMHETWGRLWYWLRY